MRCTRCLPGRTWNQFWKIQLMVFVTMMLMQSKERIDQLVWVMAMSIAFYGVKGGIFTIVHGGVYHVRGPEGSFIGGDNEMGLALIMTIPLLRYLQLTTRKHVAARRADRRHGSLRDRHGGKSVARAPWSASSRWAYSSG